MNIKNVLVAFFAVFMYFSANAAPNIEITDSFKKMQQYFKKDISLPTWMTDMWPLIRDICLKDLIIPGTHDSGTAAMSINNAFVSNDGRVPGVLKLLPSKMIRWCKTQNHTIGEQLQMGVRFFDFRISIEPNKELYLAHGLRGEKLADALWQIRAFCKIHPHEIVIIKVKGFPDSKCKEQDQNRIITEFLYSSLMDLLVTKGSLSVPLASAKLSQIVQSQKNIIVLYDTRVKKFGGDKLIRQALERNNWLFDIEDTLVSCWANTPSTPKLWNFCIQSVRNAPKDKLFSLNWTLTANAGYIISHPKSGIDDLTQKINWENEKNYSKNYVLSALIFEQSELGHRFNIICQDFMTKEKSKFLIKQNQEMLRKKFSENQPTK